ncbi:hypothetical protein [Portibacter lacus]|uniref:Uncharacterized protein n=1 Tax=Portibacter lacus TaxID=1099794 RepID=A0AA37SSR2_9BACT|nr:hypothetical protein [Portibacter lacus]GLR19044.1 hypothetical protein GCM10007940_36600 [Portibacter lacus]
MIKIFRKIRQKLISENKFSKYLIYSIGEIVLVVIGILIALQINNKNDERKAEESVKKFYKATILDLDEASNATKTQLNWFEIYQDLNFTLYEQSRKQIPDDSTLNINLLIWTHSFRSLITDNYESKFDQINNAKIQELFRDILWREQLVVEAIEEWNLMKIGTLRPFFFKKNINNVDESFSAERYKFIMYEVELLDRDQLIAQYNTSEFNQILYELRHKTSWAIECFKGLEASNQNLKLALEYYLEGDYLNLNEIKALKYYMKDE